MNWILLFSLYFNPSAQADSSEPLLTNPEPATILRSMNYLTRQALVSKTASQAAIVVSSFQSLIQEMREYLEAGSYFRVNRSGDDLEEYEANSQALFGEITRLPPENKNEGRWSFKPVNFQLEAKNLFIGAFTLKGSRTMRIKRITLFFYKGDSHAFEFPDIARIHQSSEFEKRRYLPWMRLTDEYGKYRIRNLRSIEIIGSAQDGNFSSTVQFKFLCPNYKPDQTDDVLELLKRLERHWRSPETAAKNWAAIRASLNTLERRLNY